MLTNDSSPLLNFLSLAYFQYKYLIEKKNTLYGIFYGIRKINYQKLNLMKRLVVNIKICDRLNFSHFRLGVILMPGVTFRLQVT